MKAIRDGHFYRLPNGESFRASDVTATHAKLHPVSSRTPLHSVAFGTVYRVDATGNTHPTGFNASDLASVLLPDHQTLFPWAPKRKRRPMSRTHRMGAA